MLKVVDSVRIVKGNLPARLTRGGIFFQGQMNGF